MARIDAHRMGYVLAVAGAAAVALLRWGLDPYLGDSFPYTLFYFPIALAAYTGGWRPGLLALVLGTATATVLFVQPRGSLQIGMPLDRVLLVLFVLTSTLIVGLAGWARIAHQRAWCEAQRLRQTLESMSDAHLRLDSDWRVVDMNGEAERVLQRLRSDLVGKNVWAAFPGARELRFGTEGDRAMNFRVPVRYEEFYPPLGKWLEMSVYPCDAGVAAFFRDVTQQKRNEESRRWNEVGLRLLFDASTRLLMAERPEEALRGIFDAVADHLKVDAYVNYLVTPDGHRLHLNAFKGLDEDVARSVEYLQFGEALCGTAAAERRRVVVDHMQLSQDARAVIARALGVRAYACHPFVNGGVHGTIAFGARDRDRFTEEELGFMRSVADQVTLAMVRQRLTQELERRAAALDGANKSKDHFLAVLSHELRTPLTPVLASVSILQVDPHLDSETRHTLDVVRRNVELEARLIDDLLDMTRIARGKVELDKRPVALCDVVLEALEVCQPDIEARRLHFDLDIEPGATCWVEADAARLQQVFWNLLKNAIKFTPPDGCLHVTCRRDDSHVIATVQDSGEGIEREALGRIFNAFEQAERSITRQFGGLGLGLAISKALVELHGGTIEACSEGRGKGSTFQVRLPLIQPPVAMEAAPAEPSPAQAEGPDRPLEVLLVEDHGDTARILSRILTRRGYRVETAGDTATALDKAGRHHFDLLVSDLGLPDRSGLELIRELRSRGQTLPAIALSGYGLEEDVNRSREAGFNVHMTKPVNFEQFYRTIAAVTG